MIKYLCILPCALLAIPALCAGQDVQPKTVHKKSSTSSRKVHKVRKLRTFCAGGAIHQKCIR